MVINDLQQSNILQNTVPTKHVTKYVIVKIINTGKKVAFLIV